jgi:hypothetical protein
MSKDDELAAKTRRQVDNAVSWLEKRYFTDCCINSLHIMFD